MKTALPLWLFALGVVALLLASLCLGGTTVGPAGVLRVLTGQGTAAEQLIVFQFRMPRIFVAALAGGGLALAGAVLQCVTRNELVEPATIGIGSGAGMGIAVLLLLLPLAVTKSPLLLPFCALAGSLLAVGLVLFTANERGMTTPQRLLLTGITFSVALSAVQLLVAMRMSREVYNYLFAWNVGSLSGMHWDHVLILLPWVCALSVLLLLQTASLDLLALGDEATMGLGLHPARRRGLLLAQAAALGGACIAIVGNLGFVGLLAPHLARQLAGHRAIRVLPAAGLCGATLLVMADTAARSLPAAIEYPAGVLVTLLGAPYFLVLLLRARV